MMKIYVKEFFDVLRISTILPWIHKSVCVLPFHSFGEVKIGDIIIISRLDSSILYDVISDYTVIVYEEFFEKILLNATREYQYNYDYYYMKNALDAAIDTKITTIISGSSYGLYGIDGTLLSDEINLSMTSQDLYYSLKGIYRVCNHNASIKNIVFCLGYYYFFSDLSKTQNPKEIQRISKVYEPLYNDRHNCILLPPKDEILYKSNIFDVPKIVNAYAAEEYQRGYFHEKHPRRKFATKSWDDKNKDWIHLSISEKKEAGKRRAQLHSKVTKRKASLVENIELFQSFLDFCAERSINILLVVTPVTSYYLNCMPAECKVSFYEVLNCMHGEIHLLDLAEDSAYGEQDFNDTDHLSDVGAGKLTDTVLATLHQIN